MTEVMRPQRMLPISLVNQLGGEGRFARYRRDGAGAAPWRPPRGRSDEGRRGLEETIFFMFLKLMN